MGWLRRRGETLNEKLMREAGLSTGEQELHAAETIDPEPLEFQPRERGAPLLGGRAYFEEPGTTGIARPRRWDVTTMAEAPGLAGDEVDFDALPDGSLLVVQEVGDESLAPLAEAVEQAISAPYRARGVRQTETTWAVAANRIEVVELPEAVAGDQIDIAVRNGERTVVVDNERSFGSIPELERLGSAKSRSFVVHAERLDGQLWEVRVASL